MCVEKKKSHCPVLIIMSSSCDIVLLLLFFFQSMAELLAENYHNIWARKKKIDLEAKGRSATMHLYMILLFIQVIEK